MWTHSTTELPSCINSNCDMHTPLSVQIPEERMLLAGTGEERAPSFYFLRITRILFHKIFSNRSISSSPVYLFSTGCYAISIIQQEITRTFSKFLLYLSLIFFFSLLNESLFDDQHRRGISKDNGLVMATVRREETRIK